MARLRPGQIAELACASAGHDAFELGVLQLLDRQLGVDVAFFSRPHGVSPVALGLEPAVRPHAVRNWASMGLEIRRLLPEARRQGGVVVDSEHFGSELQRLVYYQTFMRPHRGRTTLLGFLLYQGRCVSRLILGRKHGSPDFQPRDRACLRELLPTLSVAQHGYLLAAGAPQAAVGSAAPAAAASAAAASAGVLSPREREVCSYLGLGYTNEQIARALGTAPRTVRNQLSSVYQKLGVASRAEAVAACHGSNVPWLPGAR